MNNFDAFFYARSIAVVGASAAVGKTGYTILKNIIDAGFTGKIFPINTKADTILGFSAYKSLIDVRQPIDLAVFTIPAASLPDAMEQAGQAGIKAAVIITGGLGEVGNAELEQQVLDIAKRNGIRVIGPNCQGVTYTHNHLCASWPLTVGKGSVAIISQSGTIGAAMSGWLIGEGIGISGFVSMGNKSDIDECDLLEFFAEDPNTRVIALNIEGVRDGLRFIEVCSRISSRKPIVVLKPGRSEKGKAAAASHTKSVAGDAKVFRAVCKKAGLIEAITTQDFYDYTKALALGTPVHSPEVLVLTSSGGSGILAVDAAEAQDLYMPELTAPEHAALKSSLPGHCVVRNPLDMTGDTDAERYVTAIMGIDPERLGTALLIFGDPISGAAKAMEKISRMTRLKLVACYIGGGEVEVEETALIQRLGYPVFPTPERTIGAIKALYEYGHIAARATP